MTGPDLGMKGDGYEATSSYEYYDDNLAQPITVSYVGIVTRDASGSVVFTR